MVRLESVCEPRRSVRRLDIEELVLSVSQQVFQMQAPRSINFFN
jgi:hypothetical protein